MLRKHNGGQKWVDVLHIYGSAYLCMGDLMIGFHLKISIHFFRWSLLTESSFQYVSHIMFICVTPLLGKAEICLCAYIFLCRRFHDFFDHKKHSRNAKFNINRVRKDEMKNYLEK